ncbi:MAG: hypothetical protein K8R88_08310 [Armatimonadetes bacterium]|nr:hypothetical protein [Armatimonadota bacterium]
MGHRSKQLVSRFARLGSLLFGGFVLAFAHLSTTGMTPTKTPAKAVVLPDYIVIGYNDLGMHCMNEDFTDFCLLPPANTMRATVIDRTHGSPEIITQGVTVEYDIPGNTTSANKTNFWRFAQKFFGVPLPDNMGLFGKGLSGTMDVSTADRDFIAPGIPLTPKKDDGTEDSYQFARLTLKRNGQVIHVAAPVIPVSWEMHCDTCHMKKPARAGDPRSRLAPDVLTAHDQLHGTKLRAQKPVLCASCHADAALGAPGVAGVSSFSKAMHNAHDKRMDKFKLTSKNECYSCHPGVKTQCQRDIHSDRGLTCNTCHGTMADVANPTRRPWVDLPKCGDCHTRQGFEFEQPGKLFRDSKGHGGVKCVVCHNSPHAILPATQPQDNFQVTQLQGFPDTLRTCTVCHKTTPSDPFPHRRND